MKINLLSSQIPNTLTALPTSVNFSNQLCPDNYVADLSFDKKTVVWQFTKNYIHKSTVGRITIDYSSKFDGPVLLIVLESPHSDEYDNNGQPIGPALGSTGNNFDQHFLRMLNSSFKFKQALNSDLVYKVIFINSVQYQASQGLPLWDSEENQDTRDKNWIRFWDLGFSKDIINRLEFYEESKVILNLCTIGKSNLKDKVSQSLRSSNIRFYLGTHPASWDDKSYLI